MPLAFQVANLPITPPKVGENGFQELNPRRETLPKGWQSREGARALSEDLIAEHDVAVKVRDGCTLYCDVYRPVGSDAKKVPAIVTWSPYGKKFSGIDMMANVRDQESDSNGLSLMICRSNGDAVSQRAVLAVSSASKVRTRQNIALVVSQL